MVTPRVLLLSYNTMHSGPVALLVKPAWSASPVFDLSVNCSSLALREFGISDDSTAFPATPLLLDEGSGCCGGAR